MCTCVHTCMCGAHMWWSEDNLQGSFLSFHQAGSGERTHSIRLGSMCHYPSRYLMPSDLAVSVTTHQTVSPSCHCYILRSPLTTSTHEPFQFFLLNTTWVMAEGWRWQGVAILETFHTRERCMAFRKETAAPINDIFTNQVDLIGNASLACIWPFRIYSRKQFIMNNLP